MQLLRQLIIPVDQVTRDWLLVVGGHVTRMALGLIPSVLIARSLGTADFGIYGVLAAASGILGVIVDMGLTATAARQIGTVWPGEPDIAQQRSRVFFWTRMVLVVGVTSICLLLARPIAYLLLRLQTEQATYIFCLTLLGVVTTALSGSMSGLLQATRQFKKFTLIAILNTGATALLAIAFSLVGRLTLSVALVVLGTGTALLSFIAGRYLLPHPLDLALPRWQTWTSQAGAWFRFSRWVAMSNILAVLTAQLDVILLNQWSNLAAVGAYFLALNLVAKVDFVNHSLYTVLLPTAASLKTAPEIRNYVRLAGRRSLTITLVLLPLFLLGAPFIRIAYGPAFAGAVPLFHLLLLVVIFDVFTLPVTLLAFPLDRPQLLATADAVRAGTLLAGAAWLIPIYGPVGVIVAKGGAKVLGVLFILVALRRLKVI